MKQFIAILFVIVLSTMGFAQSVDNLTDRVFDRSAVKWLAEIEVSQNGWNPFVSDEELTARFGWLVGLHGVGLGPNTRELLRGVDDAELRSDPEIAKWMKPSARQKQGRILDTNFRFQLVTGGSASSGDRSIGLGSFRVQVESGKATAKIGVKATNLDSLEAKIFWFETSYGSTNLTSAESYAISNLFRKSGLPNFRYDSFDGDSSNRRGYVVVAKLWLKLDKEFGQITGWMDSVSDQS